MLKTWDIFCKVVDNFGDIGVCWRLAKQLQREHGLQVRLWVDDLGIAQHLIPTLALASATQYHEDICIQNWYEHADFSQAADVVIEGFACGLPSSYLSAMVKHQSKWLNLEYLSAESWVDDFHGKPSPQANGLVRYFYCPGFTEKSGGLIRESNMTARLQSNPDTPFLQQQEPSLNKNSRRIAATQSSALYLPSCVRFPALAGVTENEAFQSALKISLFCYPNAPISDCSMRYNPIPMR